MRVCVCVCVWRGGVRVSVLGEKRRGCSWYGECVCGG